MSDQITVKFMPRAMSSSVVGVTSVMLAVVVLVAAMGVPAGGVPVPVRSSSSGILGAGQVMLTGKNLQVAKRAIDKISNTKRDAGNDIVKSNDEIIATDANDIVCFGDSVVDICNDKDIFAAYRRIYNKSNDGATTESTAKLVKTPFDDSQLPPFRYEAQCDRSVNCVNAVTAVMARKTTMPVIFLKKRDKSQKEGCSLYKVCKQIVQVGCPCEGPNADVAGHLASTSVPYSPVQF